MRIAVVPRPIITTYQEADLPYFLDISRLSKKSGQKLKRYVNITCHAHANNENSTHNPITKAFTTISLIGRLLARSEIWVHIRIPWGDKKNTEFPFLITMD